MERLFYLKLGKRLVLPLVLLPLDKKQATDEYFLQRLLVVLQDVLKDHILLGTVPRTTIKKGLSVDATRSLSAVKVSQSVAASTTSSGSGSKAKSLFFVNAGDDLRFYYHFRETARQAVLTFSQGDKTSEGSLDERLGSVEKDEATEATLELKKYDGGRFASYTIAEHELVVEMTSDFEPKTPFSGTSGTNVISRYFGKKKIHLTLSILCRSKQSPYNISFCSFSSKRKQWESNKKRNR